MENLDMFNLVDHVDRVRFQHNKVAMLADKILEEIEDISTLELKISILIDVLEVETDMLLALAEKLTTKKAS